MKNVPANSGFSYCESTAISNATYRLIPILVISGLVGGVVV
jgi:hypothetical protein